MKKRLVLGERDIDVLNALHLHGALNIRQLTQLCFGEISSETARKRIRKLHQADYIGASVTDNKEEKGRPEHLYYLCALGSNALAQNQNIPEQTIVTGPPNIKHKDHLARLVNLHLAWQRTVSQEKIIEFKFLTKRVAQSTQNGNEYLNAAKAYADVVITFKRHSEPSQSMLIVLETGNLRQVRHWEPKINAFLKTNMPVVVVALNEKRLNTLKEWTVSVLKTSGVEEERFDFILYEEVVMKGFFFLLEHCTKYSANKLLV
jgi:DNA-binding PadR family transcriptional regulator